MTSPAPAQSPLHAVLPPHQADIVDRLGRVFSAGGRDLVLVGGIVRDLLLGDELPADLDFATDARPLETRALGEKAGATAAYMVGARFGTVGLVFEPGAGLAPVTVEITTYRAEYYPHDTRHPEVAFGDSLEEDLSRRDFTVNAVAVNALTGEFHDPFDGQADLARGVIRAVGEADLRFQEDPLRLLRAARFVAQLGFLIEAETAAAMQRQAESLARISQERICNELTRLLMGRYAAHGLEALVDTGLLEQALPELAPLVDGATGPLGQHREKDLWDHTKRVVEQAPQRPVVRWAALLHDAGKPATRGFDATGEIHFIGHEREGARLARKMLGRLKAERGIVDSVSRIVELHGRPETYEATWTDSAVRRLMLEAGGDLDNLLDLAAADVTSARAHRQRAAAERVAGLRAHIARLEAEHALDQLKSPLDGDDLMRLFDRTPGRWIATIKDHLREMVIDGNLAPGDQEAAERIAREMAARGEA